MYGKFPVLPWLILIVILYHLVCQPKKPGRRTGTLAGKNILMHGYFNIVSCNYR